jgi:L,D-peptidoglycan transpeptidase YkuD (ErfK/YbiS/YcfS/YnhG family)
MDLIIQNNMASWGEHTFPFTHGPHGFTERKREGDGCTPIGEFTFRRSFYRADRMDKPITSLPLSVITPSCGWCDDPGSEHYNKYIQKPFDPSHEDLWLDKSVYDLVIVVGHNDQPPIPHQGSAIFIHMANPEFGPTKGCIGLMQNDLLRILESANTSSRLVVLGA